MQATDETEKPCCKTDPLVTLTSHERWGPVLKTVLHITLKGHVFVDSTATELHDDVSDIKI